MKLRNKITGEVRDFIISNNIIRTSRGVDYWGYKSIAKLNKEWEDYKEPKDVYFIDSDGNVVKSELEDGKIITLKKQAIGNYFETKEEAEKAVEKLKAWKRMKDTGCKPIMWRWKQDYPNDACYVEVVLKCQFDSGVYDKELDLLFGGEE